MKSMISSPLLIKKKKINSRPARIFLKVILILIKYSSKPHLLLLYASSKVWNAQLRKKKEYEFHRIYANDVLNRRENSLHIWIFLSSIEWFNVILNDWCYNTFVLSRYDSNMLLNIFIGLIFLYISWSWFFFFLDFECQ